MQEAELDMSMSAREALERDAASASLWQRRVLFGHRWPVRIAVALCLGVVLVSDIFVPLNGAVVLAAGALLVALVIWAALADALAVLRFSIELPDSLPCRLRHPLYTWLQYPCKWGAALGCALTNLVPTFLAFPSLRGSALAYWFAALLLIGLAPVGFSILLVLTVAVFAIPIVIPVGIVRGVRSRRDRRYREISRYMGRPPW